MPSVAPVTSTVSAMPLPMPAALPADTGRQPGGRLESANLW
jgi:hypothetical protein